MQIHKDSNWSLSGPVFPNCAIRKCLYSNGRSCHCTPAWATRAKLCLKLKNNKKIKKKKLKLLGFLSFYFHNIDFIAQIIILSERIQNPVVSKHICTQLVYVCVCVHMCVCVCICVCVCAYVCVYVHVHADVDDSHLPPKDYCALCYQQIVTYFMIVI